MNRRLRTSSRLGCFSFTVQPMAARQLSMSNVADSDVPLFKQCSWLSLLSFGKWTARPPLHHYDSGRKVVWPPQRDTCSLLLF